MNIYKDGLNDDWNSIGGVFIELYLMRDIKNVFANFQGYLSNTPRAGRPLYIISSPRAHTIMAFFSYIENCSASEYRKKLVNNLGSTHKLIGAEYRLTVEEADPDGMLDYFHFAYYAEISNPHVQKEHYIFSRGYEFVNGDGKPEMLID